MLNFGCALGKLLHLHLQNIRKLELTIKDRLIREKSMINILSCLDSNIMQLQKLSLNFEYIQITEIPVEQICRILENNPNLNNIKLNIYCSDIKQESLDDFFD